MEENFRKILVPIDDSPLSKVTLELALFISKFFSSRVTLLHVVSNELLTLSGRIYSPIENYAPISNATGQFPRTLSLPQTKEYVIPEEVIREVTEMYRAKGQILLSAGSSQFTLEGISIEEKLVEGADIAETIISEVESGNFDLIIMGRSSNEEKELDSHLGSVAAKVSSHVKTPILIVNKETAIRKMLVAVDGSAKDEKALQDAA
ncbi:MAG: universal stress protein, partial [Candidatus Bathyarchaeia archaeon]